MEFRSTRFPHGMPGELHMAVPPVEDFFWSVLNPAYGFARLHQATAGLQDDDIILGLLASCVLMLLLRATMRGK